MPSKSQIIIDAVNECIRSRNKELDLAWICRGIDNDSVRRLPVSLWLGRLDHVRSVTLKGNDLESIPKLIGEITNLEILDLSRNKIRKLPDWIRKLKKLNEINLSVNSIEEFSPWLSELDSIKTFNLSENGLDNLIASRLYSLSKIKNIETLILSDNKLIEIPNYLSDIISLQYLDLSYNRLIDVPKKFLNINSLQHLDLSYNNINKLDEIFDNLPNLISFNISNNNISEIPNSFKKLQSLRALNVSNNKLSSLPSSLGYIPNLKEINIAENKFSRELFAAYADGAISLQRYVRASDGEQISLNEGKLILVGEGEVGKSSLLATLRGDPWQENRKTTHGIEIKPLVVIDKETKKWITLNGWDFGGQRVYRPTHQMFFSSPAIYLVVWKPREGSQQGLVTEWIKLIKYREPQAKILVVATHGGPKELQPDIDRQEIWDEFGKDTVIDFFFVDSKPVSAKKTNENRPEYDNKSGLNRLRDAISQLASKLPEIGRKVPLRWQEARQSLARTGAAYLQFKHVLMLCEAARMNFDEANDFIRVEHRLGHIIHYSHDSILKDIIILKPDWLATAISYVFEDEKTRSNNGIVTMSHLSTLWNDKSRPSSFRYSYDLHSKFLRLMERFDLSYKITTHEPEYNSSEILDESSQPEYVKKKIAKNKDHTSLVAQLVPDIRPSDEAVVSVWPKKPRDSEFQRTQICKIVEDKSDLPANAEGLFYILIVRLHKYSLGRDDFSKSIHWQRGLILDDDYNGRAMLEYTGNDIKITVRAAYPEALLAVLTREVRFLVESLWPGLKCKIMVPCISPCGKGIEGKGLYDVRNLIESKKEMRMEFPCPTCNQWQDIDSLLRNAPTAQKSPLISIIDEFESIHLAISEQKEILSSFTDRAINTLNVIDTATVKMLSKIDSGFIELIRIFTDEAKDGPRLFSFRPMDPNFFDRPNWVSQKFCLTLWCEHSRLPLPILYGDGSDRGTYEVNLTREWLQKAGPFLKALTSTLSLVLPVATSSIKATLDEQLYEDVKFELELGQKTLESLNKGAEQSAAWLSKGDSTGLSESDLIRAEGSSLRQLHALLMEKDPSFGGLVRVLNKRQEFLWVHKNYESEY